MKTTINNEAVTPDIYVASLTDFNNGIRYGVWIDASQGVDVIKEAIQEMLNDSPTAAAEGSIAEEWEIRVYDGFFGIPIDEDASLEFVAELAEAIARHGEAFALYYANKRCYSADISSCVSAFKGAYQGEYEDEEDFAQSLIEDLGMLDNHLMCYFDYKALSRDLFNTDYMRYELYNGSIAVFRVM